MDQGAAVANGGNWHEVRQVIRVEAGEEVGVEFFGQSLQIAGFMFLDGYVGQVSRTVGSLVGLAHTKLDTHFLELQEFETDPFVGYAADGDLGIGRDGR